MPLAPPPLTPALAARGAFAGRHHAFPNPHGAVHHSRSLYEQQGERVEALRSERSARAAKRPGNMPGGLRRDRTAFRTPPLPTSRPLTKAMQRYRSWDPNGALWTLGAGTGFEEGGAGGRAPAIAVDFGRSPILAFAQTHLLRTAWAVEALQSGRGASPKAAGTLGGRMLTRIAARQAHTSCLRPGARARVTGRAAALSDVCKKTVSHIDPMRRTTAVSHAVLGQPRWLHR